MMKNFDKQLETHSKGTILCCGESECNTLNNIFENKDIISVVNLKDFNEINIEGKFNKEEVVL